MNKIILRTALITLGAIIVVLGIVSLIIGVFFPITFAKFFEDTGSNKASFYFYEKAYSKSKDINKTHTLLNKAIEFKFDKKVVQYYEKLSAYGNYQEFIDHINSQNYDSDSAVIVNTMLTNEDNRLKTRYVSSLAKIDLDKAFKFAIDDLYQSQTDPLSVNVNFVMAGLCSHINANTIKYFQSYDYEQKSELVADRVMSFYNELDSLYQTSKPTASKYTLAVYSNKLIVMLQTMLIIEDYIDNTKISTTYDESALQTALNTLVSEYNSYCN